MSTLVHIYTLLLGLNTQSPLKIGSNRGQLAVMGLSIIISFIADSEIILSLSGLATKQQ